MNTVRILLLFSTLAVSAIASSAGLETLFDKGSRWHLVIDDWDGEMIVADSSVSTDSNGTRTLSAVVKWNGRTGKFEMRHFTRDPRRFVVFAISLPNGETIEAEGSIGRETDAFMAGVTRFVTSDTTYYGAWYARNLDTNGRREVSVTGGVSQATSGAVVNESVEPGGLIGISTVGVLAAPCTLAGSIGGMKQFVRGAWVQPQSGSGTAFEAPVDSSGAFRTTVAAGRYRVGFVPNGKLELIGSGLDQYVDCPSGATVRVSAQVDRVSE